MVRSGRTQVPQAMCREPGRAWLLLRPCTQSRLLTRCTSRDSPTHGYRDSSKDSPQLNWGQHWPASRATGTGTKPGSGQVGWGQNFLWQVSVASLQMQSWQSMLMVWPGYGGTTHESDLRASCSARDSCSQGSYSSPTCAEGLCSKPGERTSELQGLRR